jgi:hypothetical protein
MKALISDSARRVAIKPWEARERTLLDDGQMYDAMLASVGYELRAFALAEALGPRCRRKLAVEFPDQHTPAYHQVRASFRHAGFEVSEHWEDAFPPFARGLFAELAATGDPVRVVIDVSSMDRKRIATVVEVLAQLTPSAPVTAHLLYVPSVYDPPDDLPQGVITLAPVSAYFAGDLQPRARPVGLVGVGYEPNKASGALSNLEIPCSAAYVPDGPDPNFRAAVLAANSALLNGADAPEQIGYEVLEPFECIELLDGPIRTLIRSEGAPVIVPLGPKIFALSSSLIAAIHHPNVQVWRASFEAGEHAPPREPDRWVCGIEVEIVPAHRATDPKSNR